MDRTTLTELTPGEVAKALAFAQQAMQGAGTVALRYFRQPL